TNVHHFHHSWHQLSGFHFNTASSTAKGSRKEFLKKFYGTLSKVRQEYSVEPIIGFLDGNSLRSDPCRSYKYARCTVKARAAGG
ncbi:MAG: hypothetical protein QXN78_06650, partial [Conexivisphaerales archaeon]